MRPDLPWNVAGIPTEAHQAARAAARREGLSVGEWLTRRILRSFADAGDEEELTRENFAASRLYRDEPVAPPSRRETDEMLDRVSRSTAESSDAYRRIEEQLKGVSRRMETSERSQAENNRALSRAATEMNVATREQAQAFEQLGTHVVGLKERLDRVEQASRHDSLKEAVKGLHTGLERLADQLTQNANQSATQISALATNMETLAGHVGETRANTETTAQILEQRIAALDDRIYTAEKAGHGNVTSAERAIEALQAAHRDHVARADHREASTAAAVAQFEDRVRAVEAKGTDPDVEQRLSDLESSLNDGVAASEAVSRLEERVRGVEAKNAVSDVEQRLSRLEKSLSDIAARFEDDEPTTARQIEDSLKKLLSRVEATENRQRDTATEFRALLNDAAARLTTLEAKPALSMAAAFPPVPPAHAFAPAFDAPPFHDVPAAEVPPPFAAQSEPSNAPDDPFATAIDPFAAASLDAPPPYPEEAPPFEPAGFTGDAFEPQQPNPGDTYLSAARRSAQAAANAAEVEAADGFVWSAKPDTPEQKDGRSRMMLIGFIALIAIALVAGFVLSQGFGNKPFQTGTSPAVSQSAPQPAAPQPATPLHATPQNDDLAPHAPVSMPVPQQPAKQTVVPPLQQKTVKAAPIHTVPAQQTQAAPKQQPNQLNVVVPQPNTGLDRLTALANGGNVKAETVIGLKYLNGDGTAINEAQAAKWLERAAESGEPIAQYRLGTLYEHGKGVAADPAKATHWYQSAAMQGNRKAMHNLAVAYAEGTGTKKDLAEAARWFSKAASLGLTDSQFNLAVLYERGQGVPQSLLDAYKWYAIAAAGGDTESKSRLDALSTQISTDDRAAAQHASDTFRTQPLDPHANTTPQQNDLVQK